MASASFPTSFTVVLGAIVSGRWRASYLGIVEAIGAVGLAVSGIRIPDASLIVAPLALAVLAVLALERDRSRRLGLELTPDTMSSIGAVEAVAIVAPLLTATIPAFGRPSAGHVLLLLGEAVIVVAWALFTRVRRRLALGALGLVAVIAYPIVQVVDGVSERGIDGGVLLALAAGLAVILIVVGSMLERGRARVGDVIRRITETLEDWS